MEVVARGAGICRSGYQYGALRLCGGSPLVRASGKPLKWSRAERVVFQASHRPLPNANTKSTGGGRWFVQQQQGPPQQQQLRTPFEHATVKQQRRMKRTADHVVLALVVANCTVYAGWQKVKRYPPKQPLMVKHFTTSVQHLAEGRYYTLLTSVFSHAEMGHLFANMVGLFFFGTQMCTVLGRRRFLAVYLGSGIISSGAAVYEQKLSDRFAFNLGASGAVNAVTAMSILLAPRSTLLIFGLLPMPAWLAGSLFICKDLYGWLTDRRDGIAHFAHLGGALCGATYFAYLRRARKLIQ